LSFCQDKAREFLVQHGVYHHQRRSSKPHRPCRKRPRLLFHILRHRRPQARGQTPPSRRLASHPRSRRHVRHLTHGPQERLQCCRRWHAQGSQNGQGHGLQPGQPMLLHHICALPAVYDYHLSKSWAEVFLAWDLYCVGCGNYWVWVHEQLAEFNSFEAGSGVAGKWVFSRMFVSALVLVYEV
jgi:hypothetical protein